MRFLGLTTRGYYKRRPIAIIILEYANALRAFAYDIGAEPGRDDHRGRFG
jgi:hypothetical protein